MSSRATPAEPAIVARDVGVKYDLRLSRRRGWKLPRAMSQLVRGDLVGAPGVQEFWAIRDVSFTLDEGEVLGLVGRNGCGKSTLLLTIAGILRPDAGVVATVGRPATLLTLGAGFEADLTGRENIYLNAAYLGFSRRRIEERLDEIVEFSELGAFIDAPLATYSTGMRARLGFSIATHVEPDILLLDEVLSVGDQGFQEKSHERIKELMGSVKALVVVTHNPRFVAELSTKVLWLERGRLAGFGEPDEVVDRYIEASRASPGAERSVA